MIARNIAYSLYTGIIYLNIYYIYIYIYIYTYIIIFTKLWFIP